TTGFYTSGSGIGVAVNGTGVVDFGISTANAMTVLGQIRPSNIVVTSNAGTLALRVGSTVISSPATASLMLGNPDGTAPVAQTLRAQSAATTANLTGQNFTIVGSLATGSATNGNILFQTGVVGSSGTTQATATTAVTIFGNTQLTQHNGN